MPPDIDVVIIGLNSSRTLAECVKSVRSCHYPRDRISIIYADGGSLDDSCRIAETCGARVLNVVSDSPSPGRQRNAGWRIGDKPFVQFLDSDTLLDPDWPATAVSALLPGVGAVCGDTRELHPERSVYNWLGDREWNGPAGPATAFGGNVMISRSALEATGGYDPALIAGEDPELSYRIRKAGFEIMKLDALMVCHDLDMTRFRQYWKRAFRTGHAYAEVNARHPSFWHNEVKRIWIRAGCFLAGLCLLPAASVEPVLLLLPAASTFLLLRPRLMLVGQFSAELGISRSEARIYAWHASFVTIPQFFGMARFWLGRLISRPLTNAKRLKRSRAPSFQ